MSTDLATRNLIPADNIIAESSMSGFEMKPRTLEDAMKFCEMMANSDLVPNSYKGKPGNIMVAIQMGSELGLTPMRALRSIAVINGRASMWGDDVLAMVLNSPVCEYVHESESTDKVGICKTKRKGCEEQVSTFTLEDAKRAGLLGKQGPWQTNTSRMLKLRARGFGLRDTFADVLAGLVSAEEALDMPAIEPESGAATLLEANQPLTLKGKLKAKVEAVEQVVTPEPIPDAPAPTEGDKAHAEQLSIDQDPSEPYKGKLQKCARTKQAITDTYNAIPETIRQSCFQEFQKQLRSL